MYNSFIEGKLSLLLGNAFIGHLLVPHLFSAEVKLSNELTRSKLTEFGDYVANCLPKYVQQVIFYSLVFYEVEVEFY